MINKTHISEFVLGHGNRVNELRNVNEILIAVIPYLSEDVIHKLMTTNKAISNMLNIFGEKTGSIKSISSITGKIVTYCDHVDTLLPDYITALDTLSEETSIKVAGVKDIYLLDSTYHFLHTPVVMHRHLIEILLNVWNSLFIIDREFNLHIVNPNFGSAYYRSFYILHIKTAEKLFKRYLTTDSRLVKAVNDYTTLKSLVGWMSDPEFDSRHATLSSTFVSYGKSVKSYIETRSPALDAEIRLLRDILIRENRYLRRNK